MVIARRTLVFSPPDKLSPPSPILKSLYFLITSSSKQIFIILSISVLQALGFESFILFIILSSNKYEF